MQDWVDITDAFTQDTEKRATIKPEKLCDFGIRGLDDSLIKILPNDLITIGADTGIGKSTIALSIAVHNAKHGRKVAMFYLEGKHEEAIRRLKWHEMCRIYYNTHDYYSHGIDMNYKKWIANILHGDIISRLESEVYANVINELENNIFFYKVRQGLTIEGFTDALRDHQTSLIAEDGMFKDKFGLDLILIDHLQYFSLTAKENEYAQVSEILRTVKDVTDFSEVPIVLVSHLRKKSGDRGLPGAEDFHGSSNIPKISSESIIISSASEGYDLANGIYPTYFRFVKSRSNLKPNFAMRINYLSSENKYEDDYKLFRLTPQGHIIEPEISINDLPHWAKIPKQNYDERKEHYTDI